MKNYLKIICLTLAISSFSTGCSGQNEPKESVNCNSIKEAMTMLHDKTNYTITVTTKTGNIDIENNMFYTDAGFYDDFLGDEYGYYFDGTGVFYFDRYQREFTPSAYVVDKDGNNYSNIWSEDLIVGFNSIDLSEFDKASQKEFDSVSKKNKLAFMSMFKIPQTQYSSIDKITLALNGSTLNDLTFTVDLKDQEDHVCKVKNVGTTKISYLESAIENGAKVFTPSATISHIIDLFADYNYTHFSWDEDFDDVNPVGFEKYNRDYFISSYTEEYIKHDSSVIVTTTGMVGFDNYVVNEKVTLNGSYYTTLFGDNFSMITSFYYNADPFVPNVYVYPTLMEAFKEPQYFKSAGTDTSFYTTKYSIVSDFCTNFQLWDRLNAEELSPVGLYINYYEDGYKGLANKEVVEFSLEFESYGLTGHSEFVFSDFGTTREQVMEQKYAKKYVNGYYTGCSAVVKSDGAEDRNLKVSVSNKTSWLLNDAITYEFRYDSTSVKANDKLTDIKVGTTNISTFTLSGDGAELKDGVITFKKTGKVEIFVRCNADSTNEVVVNQLSEVE